MPNRNNTEPIIHLDFESKAVIDIKKVGAYKYLRDSRTKLTACAWAVNDSPVYQAIENDIHPQHPQMKGLAVYAANPRANFRAHNVAFEYNAWHQKMVPLGFPAIPMERWTCTMAKCYRMGLPGALGKAGKALNLKHQKDETGKKAMMKIAKPNRQGVLWTPETAPEDYRIMALYNIDDVECERELDHELPDLGEMERRIWQIDFRMNQTGILIDLPLVTKISEMVKELDADLLGQFSALTGGEISSPKQRAKLAEWLRMNGVELPNLRKGTVDAVLQSGDGLPPDVKEALRLRQEANKTSLAKYGQMLGRHVDGVIREILQYHGAHTGRWSGRGVQLQNLPRPKHSIRTVIQCASTLDLDWLRFVYGDGSGPLSSAIRGMFIAREGHRFLVADLSQMESRITCWLAGQDDVLDAYRNGLDIYCIAATSIFGYEVTPDMEYERQVGKVAVLALGYGGGIKAFATMSETYGVDLSPIFPRLWASSTGEERKRAEFCYKLYLRNTKERPVSKEVAFAADIIKQRWRWGNDRIAAYWSIIEDAAIEAVQSGKPVRCGYLTWFMHGQWLHCKLPSGRTMAYYGPKVAVGSRGKRVLSYVSPEKGRISTWGGTLTENIVQAVQRDILAHAIVRLDESGYRVVLHVHDEPIAEVEIGFGSLEEYVEILAAVPAWAPGLPIEAKGWEGTRYGKQ